MAKQKKAERVLTPAEEADQAAAMLLEVRQQLTELEKLEKQLTERLVSFAKETGSWGIGSVKVVERLNPAKLIGAEGKRFEALKAKLVSELPGMYVRESKTLDLGLMLASIDADAALRALLNEAGLKVVQETSYQVKAA